MFESPGAPVRLPKLSGWVLDSSVKVGDPAKGGVVMRLVRESAVSGSPRISVVLEPLKARPTVIEEYLTENLRAMGNLEVDKKIRIIHVEQRSINVGDVRAFRVRHEYTMGQGSAQVAITQVSVFMVLGSQGVTVTVAGRTELFHPLGDSIERIFAGVQVVEGSNAATGARSTAQGSGKGGKEKKGGLPPALVEPIDLGKLGGRGQDGK